MKIYTKTGDNGTTRLVDGSCVEKFNPRVEAYGTVDELNSYLGLLHNDLFNLKMSSASQTIHHIQHKLFVIGSLLATEKIETFQTLAQITTADIEYLENQIDQLTSELAPLKNFILPAGHNASVKAHYARTLCRRSERRAAEVLNQDQKNIFVLIYLNRLSDYLFTLARYVNFKTHTTEVIWDQSL